MMKIVPKSVLILIRMWKVEKALFSSLIPKDKVSHIHFCNSIESPFAGWVCTISQSVSLRKPIWRECLVADHELYLATRLLKIILSFNFNVGSSFSRLRL